MLLMVSQKIHLRPSMKLNREYFRAIIFYNFRRRFTQKFLNLKLNQTISEAMEIQNR